MSTPATARTLSWVQAVGFATGAAAAALLAVSLRDRRTPLTSWLGDAGNRLAEAIALPDTVWLYVGVAAIAFLSSLLLWRKFVTSTPPSLLWAVGLGCTVASIVFFAITIASMIVVARTYDDPYSGAFILIPFITPFLVGWKLGGLCGLWGLAWGGLWILMSRSFWTRSYAALRAHLQPKPRTTKRRPAMWD